LKPVQRAYLRLCKKQHESERNETFAHPTDLRDYLSRPRVHEDCREQTQTDNDFRQPGNRGALHHGAPSVS